MKSTIFTPFSLADDGFIMIAAKGEHPWISEDGKTRILQIVDDGSLQAQAEAFNRAGKELLLDYDHESYDMDKRTTAAGWITNVEVRPDGLYGKVRWSECGTRDVTGGNFRFTSPTYLPRTMEDLGEGNKRPTQLDTVALTNRPNMKGMKPITNREPVKDAVKNYGTSEGAAKGWATRRGAGGGSVKESKAKGGSGKAAKSRAGKSTGDKKTATSKATAKKSAAGKPKAATKTAVAPAKVASGSKGSSFPSLPSPNVGFGSKSLKQSIGERLGRAKAATQQFAGKVRQSLKSGYWNLNRQPSKAAVRR